MLVITIKDEGQAQFTVQGIKTEGARLPLGAQGRAAGCVQTAPAQGLCLPTRRPKARDKSRIQQGMKKVMKMLQEHTALVEGESQHNTGMSRDEQTGIAMDIRTCIYLFKWEYMHVKIYKIK